MHDTVMDTNTWSECCNFTHKYVQHCTQDIVHTHKMSVDLYFNLFHGTCSIYVCLHDIVKCTSVYDGQ